MGLRIFCKVSVKNGRIVQDVLAIIGHNRKDIGAATQGGSHFMQYTPHFTNLDGVSAALRGVALPPTPMFLSTPILRSIPHGKPHILAALAILFGMAGRRATALKSILFFCVSFGWRFFFALQQGVGCVSKSEPKKGRGHIENPKNKICAVALRQHNRDPTGRYRLQSE